MPRARRLLLTLLGAACLAALAGARNAAAKTVWLCKPGLADNPCLDSLTTTVIEADGSTRTEKTKSARRPKIDCFYVYPTVSGQPTPLATRAIDPEIRAIAAIQASRFASVCRPFAPVYRQFTIAGIGDPALITYKRATTAFGDVARAWNEYLTKYNHGRGVVLISHSQGTYMMRELMTRVIDPRRPVRRRLVSATAARRQRDGARGRRPRRRLQEDPRLSPSRSDRLRDRVLGVLRHAARRHALRGARRALLRLGGHLEARRALHGPDEARRRRRRPARLLPDSANPGPLGLVQDQPPAGLTTPWVSTPGLYRARCAANDDANWLRIADAGGSGDARFRVTHSIGADWGLHLVDLNLAYGNLVDVVKRQAKAYLRSR